MLRRLLTVLLLTIFLVAGLRLWQLPQDWHSVAAAPAMANEEKSEGKKEEGHGEKKDDKKSADQPLADTAQILPGPVPETPNAVDDKPPQSTLPAEFDPYADETKPASEIKLLEKLAKQKQALDAREQDIATRDALLKANEDKLNVKAEELTALKGQIEGLLKDSQAQQDAQTKSLVAIYEKMKPKDAARIFNDLEPKTLLTIAGAMKETKLSPILAAMEAQKAQYVTMKLAGRTKNLPSDVPAAGNTNSAPVVVPPAIPTPIVQPTAVTPMASTETSTPTSNTEKPLTAPVANDAPAAIAPSAAPPAADASSINPAKADKLPVKQPTGPAEATSTPAASKTP